MVQVERDYIKVGDYLSFSHRGGYWKVTYEGMRSGTWKINNSPVTMEKKAFNYEIVGSEKKKFQTLKNAKGYYQYEDQMLKDIAKGSIKIFELKEVEEIIQVEKYVDTKKKSKTTTKSTSKTSKVDITEVTRHDLSNVKYNNVNLY